LCETIRTTRQYQLLIIGNEIWSIGIYPIVFLYLKTERENENKRTNRGLHKTLQKFESILEELTEIQL
jgi:hypothetical protein